MNLLKSFHWYKSGIAYLILGLAIFSCRNNDQDKNYYQAAQRSLIEEVDLILIGQPYSIIDEKWLAETKTTTYHIDNLKKQIHRYGGNWDRFQEKYKDQMKINGDIVSLETEGTSHFTNYDYDAKIPIVFYGKKFFEPSIHQKVIHQQHIVPTIARLIGSPAPNGAKLDPLPIIKKTNKSPEAVLTIVIDQGGMELYKAHPHSYPHIKRIMDKGAYFPNAEVGHLDAHTGVGHVAIGTGAYPADHSVIANSRTYVESNGRELKFREKKLFENDFASSGWQSTDPSDMKTESLADVWDIYRDNKPVIISQCYAVRASIGMAGHGSSYRTSSNGLTKSGDRDLVYWLDKNTMSWKTNTNLYNLPPITSKYGILEFNLKNNPNPWWLADEKSGQKLDTTYFSKKFYNAVATPTQARLEGELFRDTVRTELIQKGFSQDGETDLLYLTLKATDAVGHAHGWESEEARMVLEETDRQVGLILAMMEEEWGDDFALVLTADHGAAPLREFSHGIYLKHKDFIATVQKLLPESVRSKESLVRFYTSGMIGLNREVMEKHQISEYSIIRAIESIEVDGRKFYKKVYRRIDLMH